jgi:cysteine desulfurase
VKQLAQTGITTHWLKVDSQAVVNVADFEQACAVGAELASVIYANNEVGTIQPIAQLAQIAHQHGVLFHTDAVQAGGQLPLDVAALGVDLLSLAAHKFYGPKGVGVLYVREGVPLRPTQTGGSHENGRRAGTHNTPLIVGMAHALELAYAEQEQRRSHLQQLRTWLIDAILTSIPDVVLTGHPIQRLPSHASFIIAGVEANQLLMHLDMRGIAASSGSACKTGNPEPSDVLLAMGYSRAAALSSLRLTLGKDTTQDDLAYTVEQVAASVTALRKIKQKIVPSEQKQ